MVVSLLWFTRLFSESTEMAELLRLAFKYTRAVLQRPFIRPVLKLNINLIVICKGNFLLIQTYYNMNVHVLCATMRDIKQLYLTLDFILIVL